MRTVNSDGELVEYNKDKDPEMMKAVQVGALQCTTVHYGAFFAQVLRKSNTDSLRDIEQRTYLSS